MRHGMRVPFPIASVERGDGELRRLRVEAAHVHAIAVGVRARNIERLDTANLAERMLGDAGIEGVGRDVLGAAHEFQSGPRHDEMQITRLRADRAIALARFDVLWRLDLESHRAAMAAPMVPHAHRLTAIAAPAPHRLRMPRRTCRA